MNEPDLALDSPEDASTVPSWVTHPGLLWMDRASCRSLMFDESGDLNPDAIGLFFVDAGHVITDDIKQLCRRCPVRRECLIHSFIGAGGKKISAGYFAGFSYGQRKSNTFDELFQLVEDDSAQFRHDGE